MSRNFSRQQPRKQARPAFLETNAGEDLSEPMAPLKVVCQHFGCKNQATSWFEGPKCSQHSND